MHTHTHTKNKKCYEIRGLQYYCLNILLATFFFFLLFLRIYFFLTRSKAKPTTDTIYQLSTTFFQPLSTGRRTLTAFINLLVENNPPVRQVIASVRSKFFFQSSTTTLANLPVFLPVDPKARGIRALSLSSFRQ